MFCAMRAWDQRARNAVTRSAWRTHTKKWRAKLLPADARCMLMSKKRSRGSTLYREFVHNIVGMFPGRMLAGIYIQRSIDFYQYQLSAETWGVARALHGEFILPDEFGTTPIVPVTRLSA